MWSKDMLDRLRIIYGDDLNLIGNTIVAKDEEDETIKVIKNDGELLTDDKVYGVGYEIGPGGYHYIILTSEKVLMKKERLRRWGNNVSYTDASCKEYKYKIFNSDFSCERVGVVRTYKHPDDNKMCIDLCGKLVTFYLRRGMLSKDKYGFLQN